MNERKPFLLRLSPRVHDAMRRWAETDMRSLNGQIEFVLRQALRAAGRLKSGDDTHGDATDGDDPPRD